ncbi:FecR family protein [Salmonirosea aquatica]|uniref:DUF4974 domain-containing protein n=1 Tax=Salmonirosea aquatica TaxID=2654236 RepID=A0A7C9BLA4_9BACT|nr:DUF4974 domain-containing protein [Cytophagaceae bacterium SJW1-29]
MKNYLNYKVDDFFQDLYFRKWVLDSLPTTDHFWTAWYVAHPEQREIIEEAKALVLAFQCEDVPVDADEVKQSVEAIMLFTESGSPVPLYGRVWFRVAACLLVGLGFTFWIASRWNRSATDVITTAQPHESDTLKITSTANSEAQIQNITLHDGSKITLKANSTLRIAEDFDKTSRVVYLTGEALFEVAKDPQKPFLVYTENLVTRVLGTSFEIRDFTQEKDVSVSVKTGKVTVFKNKSTPVSTLSENIILMPNQQAVYVKADRKLVKTIVENPVKLHEPMQFRNFVYNEAPIPQVLSELEDAYGVKIIFDEQQLKHCNLTARMTNEPLFEKLTLICETIQARYEIVDGQIVVDSRGCH